MLEIHHSGREPLIFKGENSTQLILKRSIFKLGLCLGAYELLSFSPYLTGKSSESSIIGAREPWLDMSSRTSRFGEL